MLKRACETVVGRCLKPTSARWQADRAQRVVSLCSLLDNDHSDAF